MNTIIYCASWERGEEQFDILMQELQAKAHIDLNIVKRKRGSFATDIEGNSWRVVYAYHNARGYKWHTCYVDEEISLRVFNTIIQTSKAPACFWVGDYDTERSVYYF